MAVVAPANLDKFMEIINKWEVEASVIGEVTGNGRLTIDHDGHRIVDVDPKSVAHDGPVYDRPYERPDWQDELQSDSAMSLPAPEPGEELRRQLLQIVTSPNQRSKDWITKQYDRFVRGNTALAQPDDAGVVRVDEETGRGVAIATDANGWYTKLNPYVGAQQALAESYRNVATVGATPRAITDCLNFGNPERPELMWQLVEAMTGLADGCRELGIPVTGGNVSLYNTSGDVSINPTPVVGMLGVMDDVTKAVPSGWDRDGLAIVALGADADSFSRAEFDGSVWAREIHDHLGGQPPRVDLGAEVRLGAVLIALAQAGISVAAHDLSDGGLFQTLVESVLRSRVGASVDLTVLAGGDDFVTLLSETQARAIVAVPGEMLPAVYAAAQAEQVTATRIGTTGGDILAIEGEAIYSFSFDELAGEGLTGVTE